MTATTMQPGRFEAALLGCEMDKIADRRFPRRTGGLAFGVFLFRTSYACSPRRFILNPCKFGALVVVAYLCCTNVSVVGLPE